MTPRTADWRLLDQYEIELNEARAENERLRAEVERLTAALRALEPKPAVEAPEMCWHTENKP